MAGPTLNEMIEHEMHNLSIVRGWSGIQKYDVLFTDKGLMFLHVGESVMTPSRKGLSINGFNVTQAAKLVGKAIDPNNNATRNKYSGKDLPSMLGMDKQNFYLDHNDISSVTIKKKLVGAEMCFESNDGKIKCDIPGDMMDVAKVCVSKRLSGKLTT